MHTQIRLMAAVGLLSAVLAGCGGGGTAGGGTGGVARGDIALTAADNGTVVSMSTGNTLTVTLAGNPTTGYAWEIAAVDAAVLAPAGEPQYVSDDPPAGAGEDIVGGGGTYTFTFTAVAPGDTTLSLVYRRPFEPDDTPPIETFAVNATVAE